jgi:hypothetical protein
MKEFYLWAFTLAGVLWVSCLTACYFGLRLAIKRPAASIRKALALCVLPAAVSFAGWRVFTLHYDYAAQTHVEGSSQILSSSHWHVESWWFFSFSAIIATICTLIVAVIWIRTKKEPNQAAQTTPGLRPSVSDL